MNDYRLNGHEFLIDDFDIKKTFSSFLPGIAGKRGVPLWAFYVNRGQAIASFGVQNKDMQILEFKPAVTAYERVNIAGFRTFVKVNGKTVEFFGVDRDNVKRTMAIARSYVRIEEENNALGLTMKATYFGLPNEDVAGLVRRVEIINHSNETISFELLDGLSQLFPHQIANVPFHTIGNLLRSWMDVYGLEHDLGFFRMRSSSSDTAEVVEDVAGNFYVTFVDGIQTKPLVDQNLIFGSDTSKSKARRFEQDSLNDIIKDEQVTANKIPVAFTPVNKMLKPGESTSVNTVIGHIHNLEQLLDYVDVLKQTNTFDQKFKEAQEVVESLLTDVGCETSKPLFDQYVKQNYMDNLLRGGYPITVSEGKVYHLFSRRHGDLERDYNYFQVAAEFYSQGNGSFRDVCQNRRNDGYFVPEIKGFNAQFFADLIQMDGYNPMSIEGVVFTLDAIYRDGLLKELFENNKQINDLLSGQFTPGQLINTMFREGIETTLSDEALFEKVFKNAKQHIKANFAEGYWIDHWTYILDLVETYEAIYPDMLDEFLFKEATSKVYQSTSMVLPRHEKIVRNKQGQIRRYGSLLHDDHNKIQTLGLNKNDSNWHQDVNGKTIKTSVYGKLLMLAVNKMTQLDPSGMGIDMEADKPGWNDAMNGLPGLFGSGVSETIELNRLASYLHDHLPSQAILVPEELKSLSIDVSMILESVEDDFMVWDLLNNIKESYREDINLTSKGLEAFEVEDIERVLKAIIKKTKDGILKAQELGGGLVPTYLVHEAVAYDPVLNEDGSEYVGHYGLPVVKPLGFTVRALPHYLEAPARLYKIDGFKHEQQYEEIIKSDIYDHELKFYKTSTFLDAESNEIGRGRSFTKGWQERESNFLHMSYKYLLGELKAGLYDQFYKDIETNFTCFMDPEVYGRNPLENSSFIASSINPDPFVRGQGFVARLSGSTAELLSIYQMMMFGKHPFVIKNGELELNLEPKLHASFFKEGVVSARFLGDIDVVYHQATPQNTYEVFNINYFEIDGKRMNQIKGQDALRVRNKDVKRIDVYC
jgi:hypothetical protein